jgi:multiple sugar transport system substrate-binding protein
VKRLMSVAALAAAVALGAAACGNPGGSSPSTTTAATGAKPVPELSPNQKVTITLESYNFGLAGPWTDTFNELLATFKTEYPNITVVGQKPLGSSPNPANDAISSVQQEAAAGKAPDVDQQGFDALDFMVNSLGAKPLQDVVGASALDANFGGAHPFSQNARTLADDSGKTYGVPFVLSTPVLYYNRTLFTQAGLDPSKPPTTWAEVATDALAIKTRTGKDGAYLDCLTKGSKDWCLQSLVRSNGGQVISTDRSKLSFADAATVQAVTMAQSMVTSGATPKLQQKPAYTEFAAGDMGMILETSSVQSVFQKGAQSAHWDLAATTEPSFGSQPVIPTSSGSALFLLSKDPAKQRAAWDLIKFLTSDKAYDVISSKIGYLPLRPSLVDSPADLKTWADANPLIRPNLDQLTRMEPWVAFPGDQFTQIRDGMMQAVESIVYQGKPAGPTLTAAQTTATALLPKG